MLILRQLLLLSLFSVSCLCQVYIGVLNFPPLSVCTVDVTASLDDVTNSITQDFYGFDIDILIRIYETQGADLSQTFLKCYVDQTSVLAALNAGVVSSAVGGIEISSNLLEQNFLFSLPLYSGGLKIAVQNKSRDSIWSFFQPFHWSLWIVILLTAVFVGGIAWKFEDPTPFCSNESRSVDKMTANALEMLWQSFSSLFFASSIKLQTFSARIVFLGFWLLVAIITTTYVSNLTSILASRRLTAEAELSTFSSVMNSSNAVVFTIEGYQSKVSTSNTRAKFITYPRTKEGLNRLVTDFHASGITPKALLLDSPLVKHVHSRFPCSTTVLIETMRSFNYGIIFVNASTQSTVDTALYDFIDDPYWLNLLPSYLHVLPEEHTCFFQTKHLEASQLAGLWIIIGITVVLAIIIDRCAVYQKKSHIKKLEVLHAIKNSIHQTGTSYRKNYTMSFPQSEKEESAVINGKHMHGMSSPLKNIQKEVNSGISYRANSVSEFKNNSLAPKTEEIEESEFLLVSDYIHIPSKDVHLLAKEEISTQTLALESLVRSRFAYVEDVIAQIMKNRAGKSQPYSFEQQEPLSSKDINQSRVL